MFNVTMTTGKASATMMRWTEWQKRRPWVGVFKITVASFVVITCPSHKAFTIKWQLKEIFTSFLRPPPKNLIPLALKLKTPQVLLFSLLKWSHFSWYMYTLLLLVLDCTFSLLLLFFFSYFCIIFLTFSFSFLHLHVQPYLFLSYLLIISML